MYTIQTLIRKGTLCLVLLCGAGAISWGTLRALPSSFFTTLAFAETLTYERIDDVASSLSVAAETAEGVAPENGEPTFIAEATTTQEITVETATVEIEDEAVAPKEKPESAVRTVPFYSQFADISAPEWRKIGCGIAALAMLIDYYRPAISVDTLLQKGIESGAYIESAGWSHAGLINIAKDYSLTGEVVGMSNLSMATAFSHLEDAVTEGPIMVSVHYTFEPTNPIPHLVVVTGIENGLVYYNDPAEESGGGFISIAEFQNAWKKRYVEIRPTS